MEDPSGEVTVADGKPTVPPVALLLSLLSLWVPVLSSAFFPNWTNRDVGILVWLLAFVPGFLLSYYRGWRGASLALAAGMAALSLTQVFISVTGSPSPPVEVLMGIVVVLTAVSLGSGVLSSFFHRSLADAERMALTDSSTGIPNRRHAILELERGFAAAKRGAALSVVLFDLDHFKEVNDRYGHAEGDRVLVEFAGILRSAARAMNVVARFGGEEFIAILRESDAEGAQVFAERIREKIKSLDLPAAPVTVSAGVAEYEEGMSSPDVLVAAADQALYRAKREGRDRVAIMDRKGRLPGSAAEERQQEESDSAEPIDTLPRGSGELLLVVDDDPDALRSVARALRRLGYRVVETPSPEHAVELVRDQKATVDLVLTDIVMPEMGGFRLVEILNDFQPVVRALYMSGYSQEDVDWAGVPGTVVDYISKPTSLETLAGHVRRLIEAPVTSPNARAGHGPDGALPTMTEHPARRSGLAAGPDTMVAGEPRILVLHSENRRARRVYETLRDSGLGVIEESSDPGSVIDRLASLNLSLLVVDLALSADALGDLLDLLELPPPERSAILVLVGAVARPEKSRFLRLPMSDFVEPHADGDEIVARVRNLLQLRSLRRWRAEE